MKTILIRSFSVLTVLAVTLLAASPARAQITAINANSVTTNIFFDNNSKNPSSQPGSVYTVYNGSWNGSAVAFSPNPTPDPTTLDSAGSVVSASYSGSSYSVSLNTSLTQAAGNTGSASLVDYFNLYFLVGAGGLVLQPVQAPSFTVSGMIGSAAGSSASVTGDINYYEISGVNTTFLDTMSYTYNNSTAGSFSGVGLIGSLTSGSGDTPAMSSGDVLELVGYFNFGADPATLDVETTPEASSGMLMGLAAVCGIVWRRRAAK